MDTGMRNRLRNGAAYVRTSFFPVTKQFDSDSRGVGSPLASKYVSSDPPNCHTVADQQSPGQRCWHLLAMFSRARAADSWS